MRILLTPITIRDLTQGYVNSDEKGVYAYSSKLNVRPPYQREFIYKDEQRNKVIDTIIKGFPLNTMYWIKNDDGTFELMDGQQRTLSICQYVNNDFSVQIDGSPMLYHNLSETEKNRLLDYKLTVYICEGTEKEKTEWFETVNIAGERLTDQELSNAIYRGPWVSDAKRYFSKTSCPCQIEYKDYLEGSAIRQDYLETAIKWISDSKDKQGVRAYMSQHQNDENASELWQYMQEVMSWVQRLFPEYDKKMKGVQWGYLFNAYKGEKFNAQRLKTEIERLEDDDDVTNKKGIYAYLITGEEKHLSIRAFSDAIKKRVYRKQRGVCKKCGKDFELSEMEADHITPWCEGGKTIEDNCQMLCRECNRRKGKK